MACRFLPASVRFSPTLLVAAIRYIVVSEINPECDLGLIRYKNLNQKNEGLVKQNKKNIKNPYYISLGN